MNRGFLAITLLSVFSVSYTLTLQDPLDTLILASQPVSMGLDIDSYPPTPSGLSLEQVHVYIRHGEHATRASAPLSPFLLIFHCVFQVNEPPSEYECKIISQSTGFSAIQGDSFPQMCGIKKQAFSNSRVPPPSL